ncbi:MAG TPA: sugar phosphate isomerase/epimerase [Panacibacter sp.]|nr:sugar phosphate isomerase/epimerase [Panacibacter sp.]HNP46686.1 sugar phosphate isomerase/epimerase [Panacibacter sp.]
MSYSRRSFIKNTGLLATGAMLASNGLFAGSKMKNFGLQLWSVRDDLAKDPKEVLKQVSSYGYTQIESFEGAKGMFWGMSAMEFKALMDDLGMKIISSHCNIGKDFEKKAADAASIGMKYLICPFKGPQKSIDNFKKFADEFNEKGEICRRNGIRFAYHNHGYSFQAIDGQMPQAVMMDNTNPDTVDFEMDMYWVISGGADIKEWLGKYKNRFRLGHVKDRKKDVAASVSDASCILGTGSIDYKTIVPLAKKAGMEYFIVEQELWENSTPLLSAEADAKYMMELKG